MVGARIVILGTASMLRSMRRSVRIAEVGVGVLLVLAGSALATWPTAVLPQDLPEQERARLQQVTENASVTAQSNGESFFRNVNAGFYGHHPARLHRLRREPDVVHIHMPNMSAFWALLLPKSAT